MIACVAWASACAGAPRPAAIQLASPASAGPSELPAVERAGAVASSGSVPPPPPTAFSFVSQLGSRTVLVVDTKPEPGWRSGDFRMVEGPKDLFVGEAPADGPSLPDDHRLAGQRVALYDGSKKVCDVEAEDAWIALVTYEPQNEWAGSRTPPGTEAEIVADAKSYAAEWLVVDLPSGACPGAGWGRLASLPEPAFAAELEPDEAETAAARAALRSLPDWEETQVSFDDLRRRRAQYGQIIPAGPWDESSGETVVHVQGWAFPSGPRLLMHLELGQSCDTHVTMAGLFRRRGAHPDLLTAGSFSRWTTVLDADGDGRFEAIAVAEDPTLVSADGSDTLLREVAIPSPFCPC